MPFRFKSVFQLKRELGEYDAIVQVNEIAMRNFIEAGLESGSLEKYIGEQSLKYGIRTNHINTEIIQNRLSLKYVASVQQYAEYFYHLFRKEYEELFDTQINIGDIEGTLLDKIIEKLPYDTGQLIKSVGEINYLIISYYRKIRNKYSHYFKVSESQIEKDFEILSQRKEEIATKFQINDAPNKYSELNFNDFMLFTRALKYFSQNLCDYINPDDVVFVEYLERIKFKKHLISNKRRYKNAISVFLRTEYGIEEGKSENIFNALIA